MALGIFPDSVPAMRMTSGREAMICSGFSGPQYSTNGAAMLSPPAVAIIAPHMSLPYEKLYSLGPLLPNST